jgi:hypothetical protein
MYIHFSLQQWALIFCDKRYCKRVSWLWMNLVVVGLPDRTHLCLWLRCRSCPKKLTASCPGWRWHTTPHPIHIRTSSQNVCSVFKNATPPILISLKYFFVFHPAWDDDPSWHLEGGWNLSGPSNNIFENSNSKNNFTSRFAATLFSYKSSWAMNIYMKITRKVSSPQNSTLLIPDKPSRLHEELAKCWAASIGLGEWHCWRRITYGPENVGKRHPRVNTNIIKYCWKLCTVAYSYIISCLFSVDHPEFLWSQLCHVTYYCCYYFFCITCSCGFAMQDILYEYQFRSMLKKLGETQGWLGCG